MSIKDGIFVKMPVMSLKMIGQEKKKILQKLF